MDHDRELTLSTSYNCFCGYKDKRASGARARGCVVESKAVTAKNRTTVRL